jgi:hypothetical protein
MARAFVNGVGWIEKQTKTVDIASEGSHNITPDQGHLLSGVTVNVRFPSESETLEAIEAELDRIIAIQNELIGTDTDDTLITFTYDWYGTVHTLNAVEGMTWAEWIDTDYNTIGLTDGNSMGDYKGNIYYGVSSVWFDNAEVSINDVIISNGEYYNG